MTVLMPDATQNSFLSRPFYHQDHVDWRVSSQPVPYVQAIEFMKQRVAEISGDEAAECVWLLEHPPLLTAGTSADKNDLLQRDRFEIYDTGRGGQYTYHGPGQRVIYTLLDLKKRQKDVRAFVKALEDWMIQTLQLFHITAQTNAERVGIWVGDNPFSEEKICALGIRLRRWVSFHGLALNVNPNLDHYQAIVPCGIASNGVTSLEKLGKSVSMLDIDQALKRTFEQHFGPTKSLDKH